MLIEKKQALLETITESLLEVINADEIIKTLIEKYDGCADLENLLYKLISDGYDADDLKAYGWQDWEINDAINIIRKGEIKND